MKLAMMKRAQTVDESHNNLTKYCLLAQLSGKRSPLREKLAHPCRQVPGKNRSPSGFFHRYLVNWHSFRRAKQSVELVVAENHSIVQEKEERVNFIQRP
jgi:hypothetical protein